MIITGGSLSESEEALKLAEEHGGSSRLVPRSSTKSLYLALDNLYATVGVHPTRCSEFESHPAGPQAYLASLLDLARRGKKTGKCVAIGELGLDFDPDRLKFCSRETQEKWFEAQLDLSHELGLPLFLHNRSSTERFCAILQRYRTKWTKGVAHSFTGTPTELSSLLAIEGIFVGLNGCSLKTAENLESAKLVPLDKLMLESDAPWCDIRRTHASFSFVAKEMGQPLFNGIKKEKWEMGRAVKERNEPSCTRLVAGVVAGVKGLSLEEVCDAAWANTCSVFFPSSETNDDV